MCGHAKCFQIGHVTFEPHVVNNSRRRPPPPCPAQSAPTVVAGRATVEGGWLHREATPLTLQYTRHYGKQTFVKLDNNVATCSLIDQPQCLPALESGSMWSGSNTSGQRQTLDRHSHTLTSGPVMRAGGDSGRPLWQAGHRRGVDPAARQVKGGGAKRQSLCTAICHACVGS